MHKEGGVTGKPEKPAPPTKFLGGLLGKAKGGLMGKILNPMSMLPGKAGEIAGKIGGGGLFYTEDGAKKNTDTKKKETKVYTKENPHPMAGSKNAKGTKVIDFKGNWKNI